MSTTSQLRLTKEALHRLQRLRASVIAFQNIVAPLPAEQRNNEYNEQFNQLRLDAKSVLQLPNFDAKVAPAITMETLEARQGGRLMRVSSVVVMGVILALLGLGLNSIVLDDVVINTIGCCISSGGMLLVMGAFAGLGVSNRRRVSNLGDLYQRCEALRFQLDHALNMVLPNFANQPDMSDLADIPTAADLLRDSLTKQATDWQQKIQFLEEQENSAQPKVPLEITLTLDFARQELQRVQTELARLQNEKTTPPSSVPRPSASPPSPSPGKPPQKVQEIELPGGRKIALARVSEGEGTSEIVSPTTTPPPAPAEPPAEPPKAAASQVDTRETQPISKDEPAQADETETPEKEEERPKAHAIGDLDSATVQAASAATIGMAPTPREPQPPSVVDDEETIEPLPSVGGTIDPPTDEKPTISKLGDTEPVNKKQTAADDDDEDEVDENAQTKLAPATSDQPDTLKLSKTDDGDDEEEKPKEK